MIEIFLENNFNLTTKAEIIIQVKVTRELLNRKNQFYVVSYILFLISYSQLSKICRYVLKLPTAVRLVQIEMLHNAVF